MSNEKNKKSLSRQEVNQIIDEIIGIELKHLMAAVPPSDYLSRYRQRLREVIHNVGGTPGLDDLAGIVYELERMNAIKTLGNKEVELDFGLVSNDEISYQGYQRSDRWDKNPQPSDQKKSQIQFDIPLRINGKPYVYEVKSYDDRKPFGAYPSEVNQLLKYNRAVESGIITGATFEVKGKVHSNFLSWLSQPEDLIPNVEMIHCVDSPEGTEERTVIKKSQSVALSSYIVHISGR